MEEFRFSPRPNRANEIHWREWGKEAFEEAESRDRPILLAISAVWCHWCHVMDETSYSDPTVIDLLNREYIPIRVDNDRHPELNQRYNMGGWPSTGFLTPGGDIMTGATYLPPEDMVSIASQVLNYYRTRKEELYSRIQDQQRSRAAVSTAPSTVPANAAASVLEYLTRTYDSSYGGFGTEPKFPQADALEFLIEEYYRTGDNRLRTMVTTTLKNMASGGMFDHVAGGFFRYSTNRDWSVPHYEKMGEDNAALLRLYLHAYQILDDPAFRSTAERIVDYVMEALWGPDTGAFFGSQDADEEYYQLEPEDRARRDPPLVDRTVYTPWTASMASSFLEAARVLDRPELQDVALAALDFLWRVMNRENEGMLHYYDGEPRGSGLLTDQVSAMAGFLDAYEATGQSLYLDRSLSLVRLILDRFRDPAGGFFDIWDAYQDLGHLEVRDKSIIENSLASQGLLRLHYLVGDEEYRTAAQGALGVFGSDYLKFGPYAASYARAAAWLQEDPLRIEILGGPDVTGPWREEALSSCRPRCLVQTLDPGQDAGLIDRLGLPSERAPAAYVCYHMTCSAPVEQVEDLPAAVERLVSSRGK